jgi:hypothetical protein
MADDPVNDLDDPGVELGDDGAEHDFWRWVLEHRRARGVPFPLEDPTGFALALERFEAWLDGGPP